MRDVGRMRVKIPLRLVEEIRRLGVEDVDGFVAEAVREKALREKLKYTK